LVSGQTDKESVDIRLEKTNRGIGVDLMVEVIDQDQLPPGKTVLNLLTENLADGAVTISADTYT